MAYQNAKGIRRLVNAFRFSMKGFRACYKHEEAFRQEVYASIVVIPLGIWLGETGLERAVLVGSWMIVPLTELLNSAVEAAIDRIGPERHKLSGRAKDIGSAAVFFSLVLAATVWGLLLLT